MNVSRRGLAALVALVVGTLVGLVGLVTVGDTAGAATLIGTVDDATTSGSNRFTYSGTWVSCGGCNTGAHQNSFRYSASTGSAAAFTFVGGQASLFGYLEPQGGIASVSVDGGPAVDVDLYRSSRVLAAVYTTAALASGTHTVTMTVTGRTSSLYRAINIDKAEVYAASTGTAPTTTTTTTTAPTTTTTTTAPTTTTTTAAPTPPRRRRRPPRPRRRPPPRRQRRRPPTPLPRPAGCRSTSG